MPLKNSRKHNTDCTTKVCPFTAQTIPCTAGIIPKIRFWLFWAFQTATLMLRKLFLCWTTQTETNAKKLQYPLKISKKGQSTCMRPRSKRKNDDLWEWIVMVTSSSIPLNTIPISVGAFESLLCRYGYFSACAKMLPNMFKNAMFQYIWWLDHV